MKILFLDIDGVLCSRRSAIALNGYPRTTIYWEKFDHVAVELIRKICSQGVKIVLSSSWRGDQDWNKIIWLPIIDMTPRLFAIRGKEIAQWLSGNGEPEKWAILDDDDAMLPEQASHFVHVDGNDGLLLKDYELLCSILDVKAY